MAKPIVISHRWHKPPRMAVKYGIIVASVVLCAVIGGWTPSFADVPAPLAKSCETGAPADRDRACTALISTDGISVQEKALANYFLGFAKLDQNDKTQALKQFSDAIALDPSLWPAHWARAQLLDGTRNYDIEIEDWTSVATANANIAHVQGYLGTVLDYQGKHAEAIVAFSRALELSNSDRERAMSLSSRGIANEAAHQYSQAIADQDAAIRLLPNNSNFYMARGRAEFLSGKFTDAVRDLQKGAELDPLSNYAPLWLALAQGHDNHDVLESLRQLSKGRNLDHWPGSIIRILLGEVAPDSFATPPEPSGWSEADRRTAAVCEEAFYLGELRLEQGKKGEAASLFKRSVDTGLAEYVENNAASYEIDKLRQSVSGDK
jgi:lipoprotein NlpI